MAMELASSFCFDLQIFVYHTKTVKTPKYSVTSDSGSTEQFEVSFHSQVIDFGYDSNADLHSSERDDSGNVGRGESGCVDMDTVHNKIHTGHAMELARFMPAIHSKIWSNLPRFLAIGYFLWLGFFLMHHYYNDHDFKVHSIASRFWYIIVSLLTRVGLALCFELCFLAFQEGCPAARAESDEAQLNVLESDTDRLSVNKQTEGCGIVALDLGARDGFENRLGRPRVKDIFQCDLETSDCPGIFMCGPSALTDMVKQKARKENSCFGGTRYALYEDPFEM